MIVFSNNNFYIATKNSSYIMELLSDGILKHCYYGRYINQTNMDFYNQFTESGFDYTAPYLKDSKITTLDALPQEYPSCGRGDYRNPAAVIENSEGIVVNDFRYSYHKIHKGTIAIEGLPYLNCADDKAETLEIVLKDIISGVIVHLYYTVIEDFDIIARHTLIENNTDKTVRLNSIMSFSLDFETSDFDMISLYGRWANERKAERYSLHHGINAISSSRGAIGHQTCPFVALAEKNADEFQGDVYGVSLIYSGSFEIGTDIGQFGYVRLYGGINHENFSWTLESGQVFVTPQAVLTYSHEGLNGMSKNFHNMCRNLLRAQTQNKKHPVVLNLWEAFYFDITEEKLINVVSAIRDFGVDTLVLDDGWFGKRENEYTSLGDWFVNKEKFPNGLDRSIAYCKTNGLNFGLWFEPEVISPQSELFKNHPDWCIHINGVEPIKQRSEYLLDLSREEVIESVYESIAKILRENDISYVKWDMNRNMTDNGSSYLPKERQGEHGHRYILGVYKLMDKLTQDFPDIFFEGSAGGGGRFDFGMLYYMHQIWASDNTDAIGRLDIQWGTSMVFPPETISSHVSVCPNHQTGRTTPFKTRGDVAQLFSLGYELNPALLSQEEIKLIKYQISKHRELKNWIYSADFYRLKSPIGTDECAWQMVSDDKSQSIAMYVTKLTTPKKVGQYLKLKGLNPDKKYKVLPINVTVTGDVLMYAGLPVKEQYTDFESIIFEITEAR